MDGYMRLGCVWRLLFCDYVSRQMHTGTVGGAASRLFLMSRRLGGGHLFIRCGSGGRHSHLKATILLRLPVFLFFPLMLLYIPFPSLHLLPFENLRLCFCPAPL